MDRIQLFDTRFMKNCSPNRESYKILRYATELVAFSMSCIPLKSIREEGFAIFFINLFMLGCVSLYILPYLIVQENGQYVSLGIKLRYTPVDIELINKDRKIKLWKYIAKTVTIITGIQLISGIISKQGNWIVMLLLPLSVFIILAATGFYSIYYFIRKLR